MELRSTGKKRQKIHDDAVGKSEIVIEIPLEKVIGSFKELGTRCNAFKKCTGLSGEISASVIASSGKNDDDGYELYDRSCLDNFLRRFLKELRKALKGMPADKQELSAEVKELVQTALKSA